MTPSLSDVLSQLECEDAVPLGTREKAAAVVAAERPALPWYARGISGVYGWLAAFCFLAVAHFVKLEHTMQVYAGLAAVGAAIVLRRFVQRGFFAQLSLSVALAGEVLAVVGMTDLSGVGSPWPPLFMLAIELLLLIAYPDPLMRLLSALGVCSSLFRLWESTTGSHHLDALVLAALSGALLLFYLRPRLERGPWAHIVAPAAYGFAIAACAWLLVPLEKYTRLELGWPARVGVAVLLLGQLAVILRSPRLVAAAAPFVGLLCAFSLGSPGVLAGVALLAVAVYRREAKLVALAAVFLAAFYGWLYYSIDQTLLVKSGLMLANGLCFVTLWRLLGAQGVAPLARKRERSDQDVALAPVTMNRRYAGLALAGALLVVNGLVVRQERVLDTGAPLLVELAPADPRSLMQGDYLTLRYRLTQGLGPRAHDGRMVVHVDDKNVAAFVRWDDGSALKAGERLLRYRERHGDLRLGAEAFFFQEGKGDLYARAKYGELRVTKRGDAVLVGLRDAELERLGLGLR
ncbi:MAG: GDYXXLXY domain-containing protein [Myxococcaceae bacterium]|nr:GDYXXLXY domain-containing protein [Myxococcaceae bacterium]